MIPVHADVHGIKLVVQRRDLDEEEGQDPNFFDADYSVAASTAWLVWEGSWAVVELLRQPDDWLSLLIHGARVLELGSGTGMLGLAAAASGGHVVLSDVASMVEAVLRPNVLSNAQRKASGLETPWASSCEVSCIGDGTAVAQPLDWWHPIESQLTPVDVTQADVIIAAECAWLQELVSPFVKTVVSLLHGPNRPQCILAFRERASESSTTFVTSSTLLREFEAHGCRSDYRTTLDAPESRGLQTAVYVISYEPAL